MANGECLTSSGPSVVMSLEGGDEESPTNAGNGEVKSSSGSGAARRREAKKAAIGGKSRVFLAPSSKDMPSRLASFDCFCVQVASFKAAGVINNCFLMVSKAESNTTIRKWMDLLLLLHSFNVK